jgi:stress response protein SCP2
MAVSLQKGQKVSLTKGNAGLKTLIIGLGWDEVKKKGLFSRGDDIDCDASAFVLTGGKLASKTDVVYFGNLKHKSGGVIHQGDNLTGAGDGDDEQIMIYLDKLPPDCDRIVFTVNIFEAQVRKQHFGMIKNAFIRIVDAKNGAELCRYDLSENYNGMTAMIFGEVYKHDGEWKFSAVGQATHDLSINDLAKRYI